MTTPSSYSLALILIFSASFHMASCQQIKMKKGFWEPKYFQEDVQIDKKQVKSLLSSNPEAKEYWQKSGSKQTVAWVSRAADVGCLIWLTNAINRNNNNFDGRDVKTVAPWLAGIVASGVTMGFRRSAKSFRMKAIDTHNGLSDDNSYIEIMPALNRVGIKYVF